MSCCRVIVDFGLVCFVVFFLIICSGCGGGRLSIIVIVFNVLCFLLGFDFIRYVCV